jgi:hypothetical protein
MWIYGTGSAAQVAKWQQAQQRWLFGRRRRMSALHSPCLASAADDFTSRQQRGREHNLSHTALPTGFAVSHGACTCLVACDRAALQCDGPVP